MSRQSRFDAPGALHHVSGGTSLKKQYFTITMITTGLWIDWGMVPEESETACIPWALTPNHSHMLLNTGRIGEPFCIGLENVAQGPEQNTEGSFRGALREADERMENNTPHARKDSL